MNLSTLRQYADAVALIEDTERRIKRLRSGVTHDKVQASMHDFPYILTLVSVEGVAGNARAEVAEEEKKLEEQIREAREIKKGVDAWLASVPARMQRMIRYRYYDRMTWREIALEMHSTDDALRQEFSRYMRNVTDVTNVTDVNAII